MKKTNQTLQYENQKIY